MPSNNPLAGYDTIAANTKIQFKAGTQIDLNEMIKNGGAIEGTFYLTTDTHKLYIGRKRISDNKVYPEQVSRGVTVVGTSTELPTLPAAAPAGAIEEGELFYITDSNILAALTWSAENNRYEWVQVNPPTGITEVNTGAYLTNGNVDIRTVIQSAADPQPGAFKVVAGDNITLAAANDATVGIDATHTKANQGKITITATDTKYQAAVETQTAKGVLGLKSSTTNSFGSTLDSNKIDVIGTNSVKITSTAATTTESAKITVAGPNFTGISVEPSSSDGFGISLTGTNGDGTNLNASGNFTPHIKYGATSTYSDPTSTVAFNQNTQVGFVNGAATLNVYTKPQADQAIKDAIDSKLAVANAMTYRGVITSGNEQGDSTSLWAQVQTNGAHNGDVYKVGALSSTETPFSIGSQNVKTGDLIVISGTETNGVISIPNYNTLLTTYCDLIPSGDEPEFVGSPIISGSSSSPSGFEIHDGKVSNSNLLTVKLNSGNKINILSELDSTDATNKTSNITIGHAVTTRTDSTNETLIEENSLDDTIGTDKLKLFVLSGETLNSKIKGIKTDTYGHVTGIEGKIITFQHNYVNGIDISYGANGIIGLTAQNAIAGFNSDTTSNLKFTSSTLKIEGNNTAKELSIDLVWGTF